MSETVSPALAQAIHLRERLAALVGRPYIDEREALELVSLADDLVRLLQSDGLSGSLPGELTP